VGEPSLPHVRLKGRNGLQLTDRNFEVLWAENGRVPVFAWIKGVPAEQEALNQALSLTHLPFIFKHVALMPDVHAGAGSTIGSVIATRGAVAPATVGVDIGCGMIASRTSLTAEDLERISLPELRAAIEARVPCGRTDNGGRGDIGAWQGDIPFAVQTAWLELYEDPRYKKLGAKHPKVIHSRAQGQLGTLGTGNHFIEVCLDYDGRVWIMLHSGSRGQGNAIGRYFTEKAQALCKEWFWLDQLPHKDLAFLPEGNEFFADYLEAVTWAQDYALKNRELMLGAVFAALHSVGLNGHYNEQVINCHHNYIAREHHFGSNVYVTRKGAVRAREGDMGIIPGSMGARSYIVRGLGNRDSFCSCSHGAGRTMSRTKAKALFTLEDHEKATAGVECRKDADVLDETPGAYKDIDAVIEAERDLIEPVYTLKQVVCVKG